MKRKFSKTVALLLSVMMIFSSFALISFAEETADEKFTYTLDENNNATITGITSAMTADELKNLVIPETVGDSYPVVAVGGFKGKNEIVSVTLPETLKTLSMHAFMNCKGLKKVTMPSCESIGDGAFYSCIGLAYFNSDYIGEVVLPYNLKFIDGGAFRTANGIESIFLPATLENVGTCVFYRASNVSRIYFPETLPESVYDKEFVGGFETFKTVDAFGTSKSYIKTYADSEEAVDVYYTEKSNNRLYNYIEENSDIIVYDEAFTHENGMAMRGTVKDTETSGKIGMKARIYNVGSEEKSLKAVITVESESGEVKGAGETDITVGANSGYTLQAKELLTETDITLANKDIIKVMFVDAQTFDVVVTRELSFTVDTTRDEILVMAIGNSFAQDSITYLKAIAAADGVNISPFNCFVGGRPLNDHYNSWNNEDVVYQIQPDGTSVPGALTSSKDMVKMYNWDYVLLQGTTHNITYDAGLWGDNATQIWTDFANGVKELAPNAKRLVHATWSPYNELAAKTNSGMFANGTPDARGAYTVAVLEKYLSGANIYSTEKQADGSGALVPTAVAIDYLIRHYGFPEYVQATSSNWNASDTRGVYRDTTCHLTDNVGRVLAGLVWYEMITGTPATENKYSRSTLSDADMAKIKEAAHYACTNYATYTPEKKMFKYTVDGNGNATITGFESGVTEAEMKNIVIPSTIGGYPVKSIGESAFGYNKKIETVVVSEGIESIGRIAFINNRIINLTLPTTLKTIGSSAFQGGTTLSKVIMPSCETISDSAFSSCGSLAYMNSDYAGEIVLPSNLSHIDKYAFATCNAIKTVILPDSLKTVTGQIIWRASGVNMIYFPASLPETAYTPTFVGGMTNFRTVNAVGSSSSYIKTFAESEEAYDKYNNGTQSNKKLFNFCEENGDIIILSGAFTNGAGTTLKTTDTTNGTVAFNGRIFNVSGKEHKVTAILAVMSGDNTLEGVKTKEVTVGAHTGYNVSYKDLFVENIDLSKGAKLKVMFWNDLTNAKPLQTRDIEFSVTPSAQ